jgi:crotonobetainyl-CoA:carnitine CoA-transferase CaiB-like acyl-CoA transferase
MELRKVNEKDLDEAIGWWTSGLDRWEICRDLQAEGVAAMPSLSPLDLWTGDPQLEAIGMLERPRHRVTGEHVVAGIPWRLSNGPDGLRRAAPTLGQDNLEVLIDLLGYTPDQAETLVAGGALRQGLVGGD